NRVESQEPFDAGVVCAVRVDDNGPYVAIGRSVLSSTQLNAAESAPMGVVGKAVEVIHSVGDQIFQMGPKGRLMPPPAEGQPPVENNLGGEEAETTSPEAPSECQQTPEIVMTESEPMSLAQYDELVR
ncbi:hypothetical protein Pmar_PMAR000496, partial [Perkinsus marinus ATCC 50983]